MSRPSPESRRSSRARGVAFALLAAVAGWCAPMAGASTVQDRTATWLEERGLDELLARHLEAELATAGDDSERRGRLAARLAQAYARLLRSINDAEQRASIVVRSRRMIDLVPSGEAGELRVALVRNRYVRASQVLENERIGVADEEVVSVALSDLDQIVGELASVRADALGTVRRLERSRGRRGEDRFDAALRLASETGLLEGWSRYYLGRARGDRDQFERAQAALGTVLRGDSPIPSPDEVSFDMQASEGYANAILANAMVTAALTSPAAAMPWFERLDMMVTHENVRVAAPGWRIAALVDAGDFGAAKRLFRELVEQARTRGDAALPVAWMRLAAIGGLRGRDRHPDAIELAAAALAALAARGELAQVRSIAESFGSEALGESGFVFAYVRGLERHRAAVEARDAGDAVAASDGFEATVELLRKATGEPDAAEFPEAAASATMMIGWSLLELDRSAEAAEAFESAAERMAGERRADALWGAIVALDRLVSAGDAEATDAMARRDQLVSRFLDTFPADERSPSLVVRRIAEQDAPDAEDIDVLLAVPESHSTWEIARRRAVQALYRQFREAEDEAARVEAGIRMLAVADEILERNPDGDAMFSDLRGLDGMLLRQAAEVASDELVHEVSRAERYLGQLEKAFDRGALADVPDLPNEMRYRRMGLALGEGDFELAARLLDRMPVVSDTPEADRWVRLAALRIHRVADARIRAGAVPVEVARAAAEAGSRYLELVSLDSEAVATGDADAAPVPDRFAALDRERFLPIAVSVATALAAVFEAGGDRDDGEEALEWFREILERRPLDGSVLLATGRLSSALGEHEQALEVWRRLSRAAPEGGEYWWSAKVGQIEALSILDPRSAREVLDQLEVLHPELGPEPFRSRLEDLDLRIDVALQSSEPAGVDR